MSCHLYLSFLIFCASGKGSRDPFADCHYHNAHCILFPRVKLFYFFLQTQKGSGKRETCILEYSHPLSSLASFRSHFFFTRLIVFILFLFPDAIHFFSPHSLCLQNRRDADTAFAAVVTSLLKFVSLLYFDTWMEDVNGEEAGDEYTANG